jgi:hypothetical protein
MLRFNMGYDKGFCVTEKGVCIGFDREKQVLIRPNHNNLGSKISFKGENWISQPSGKYSCCWVKEGVKRARSEDKRKYLIYDGSEVKVDGIPTKVPGADEVIWENADVSCRNDIEELEDSREEFYLNEGLEKLECTNFIELIYHAKARCTEGKHIRIRLITEEGLIAEKAFDFGKRYSVFGKEAISYQLGDHKDIRIMFNFLPYVYSSLIKVAVGWKDDETNRVYFKTFGIDEIGKSEGVEIDDLLISDEEGRIGEFMAMDKIADDFEQIDNIAKGKDSPSKIDSLIQKFIGFKIFDNRILFKTEDQIYAFMPIYNGMEMSIDDSIYASQDGKWLKIKAEGKV